MASSGKPNAEEQGASGALAPVSECFSPADRQRLSPPGLRTFLAIADVWGLTEEQRRLVLGNPSPPSYHRWVRTARARGVLTLDVDVLTRISAVLGIHQALGILFKTEAEGVAWLRGPHQAVVFGGRSPLALIASGDNDSLLAIRRFLDAACTGLYMPPTDIDRDFRPYMDAEIIDSSATSSASTDQTKGDDQSTLRKEEHGE
jgi:Protein of unknown function (DUF2384)